MVKSLFLLIASISLVSCKSVGYHVDGHSTIVRTDTIHVSVVGDKPVVIDKVVE